MKHPLEEMVRVPGSLKAIKPGLKSVQFGCGRCGRVSRDVFTLHGRVKKQYCDGKKSYRAGPFKP